MPTRYELLYILPTTLTDEEVGGQEAKIGSLLTRLGATIESTKRLGKFRLAYPIKHQRHGHYVMVMFSAEPAALAKIDENLRITPEMVEGRDERRRRERREGEEPLREGVAKPEERAAASSATPTKVEEAGPVALKQALTSEELDKKIESALSEDVKGV